MPGTTLLLAAAARVLMPVLGGALRVTAVERLSREGRRNLLLRLRIDRAPGSVILKKVEADPYRPRDLSDRHTRRFFGDWSGARLLTEVAPAAGHGPRFLGGSLEHGFILLEDLGEAPTSLVVPLLEGRGEDAAAALEGYAARLGQMHADALGRREHYREVLAALHPDAKPDGWEARWARKGLPRAWRVLEPLVALPTAIDADIADIMQAVMEPGPFQTFLHGDPCPDNCAFTDNGLRLLDFEFSRFGHALLDAAYLRMNMPSCWCVGTIPEEVLFSAEESYRRTFARACKAARNRKVFSRALLRACGFWLLFTLGNHLEQALEGDESWGTSTIRARLLTRIEAFTSFAADLGELQSLAETAEQLREVLLEQWPENKPIAPYPAFANSAAPAPS